MTDLPDKAALFKRATQARSQWGPRPGDVEPEPAGPGEESVWDYPRPPQIRPAPAPARVEFAGAVIAASDRAARVVETAGAPVYYFPPSDVSTSHLQRGGPVTVCEWKGAAVHYDIVVEGRRARAAAFAYLDPFDEPPCDFSAIAGWFGFYPARIDAAYVGDERVRPQPGGLYAGWVTDAVKGPIKGAAGTGHW